MATASTPEKTLLDRTDGSATIDLYRAVLGPVHTDYYLKAFTRFDAAGRSGPSWNTSAALLSLNWMLFRKLWAVALAYVGAITGAALLLFGIGSLLFQWPPETQWSLAIFAALLTLVVPGAYGNAWLYAACTHKMERALRDSATMEDACSLLARQAGGRPRMLLLGAGNLLLGGSVVALAMAWPDSGALPLKTHKMEQAREVSGALGSSGLAAHSLAAAASVSAPAASAASGPEAVSPLSRSSQGLVQSLPLPLAPATSVPLEATASKALAPASAPVPAAAPASASAAQAFAQASAPAAATTLAVAAKPDLAPAAADKASASKAKASAKASKEAAALAKKEKVAKAKEASALAKARKQEAKTVAAKVATTSPAAAAAREEKFLVNVGLFADANNARNAYAKLQDAGLPAVSQEIKSSKGPLTRVRVGPFETQTEADTAAERIRALKLEAAVISQ
jgi:cell division septation protein DedD